MNKEIFTKELEKLGISITQEQYNQLEKYYELLIDYNKKTNLTSIVEKEEVFLKHYYDSLTLVKVINLKKPLSLCDIGTGAGFPGVVLKIIFPNLDIVLIDALSKRTTFLNYVIEALGLSNIKAVHDRAETFSKNNIEKFDIAVSRAVAKTSVLLEISSQLIKINGCAIFMKANLEEELKESQKSIEKLGFKAEKIETFNLPVENSLRTLLLLKKTSSTKHKYPRDFAKIKKNPL